MLDELGASMADRLKPAITNTQIITSVEPYQAQLLNKWRKGSLLVPGQTLGIIECAPAAYISIAANEAEKSARDRHGRGSCCWAFWSVVYFWVRKFRQNSD